MASEISILSPLLTNNKTDTVIINPKQSQILLAGAQRFILLNKYLKCRLRSRWAFPANWRRRDDAFGKVKSWDVNRILRRACNIKACTNYSVRGAFVEPRHQRKWTHGALHRKWLKSLYSIGLFKVWCSAVFLHVASPLSTELQTVRQKMNFLSEPLQ